MTEAADNEPVATAASAFQEGLLCPSCQKTVVTGEAVLTCPRCATTHHATCWTSSGRCSSYHCDTRTSAAQTTSRPPSDRLVITGDEAARVVLPPKRIAPATADVAARSLPPKPTAWSVASVLVLVAATVTLLIGAATFAAAKPGSGEMALLILGGIFACFVVGLGSALTAGTLHKSRTHKGSGLALLALALVVPSAVLFIGSTIRLGERQRVPFDLAAPEPPSPESFERAPAPISNAMRANVFVQGHERTGRSWCGAGVVLGGSRGRVVVLTNRHVVDPSNSGSSNELSITFATGEIVAAHVEWTAPEGVDLAVLTATATRPPRVLTRLRKDPLMVGEKTFAIGNPHSLSWTYTEGAVSRVHSKKAPTGAALDVVQTQTPIHPGNSGGGLYDADGRLVGINTWVIESEGGPGFAISTKTVLNVLPADIAALAPDGPLEKNEKSEKDKDE